MADSPAADRPTSLGSANGRGSSPEGTATPTITPSRAALYFTKTECFCFTEQQFDGGEGREMPVRFMVGTQLPPGVNTIILSYTFFNAEARS